MKNKSATGTEYVNAQLMELKNLIDKYAKIISELEIFAPRYVRRGSVTITAKEPFFEQYNVVSGAGPFFAFGVLFHERNVPSGIGGFICSAKPFQYEITADWGGPHLHDASSYIESGQRIYICGRNAYQFYCPRELMPR